MCWCCTHTHTHGYLLNNKKENAITLVALVITVIILLILAGISISSLTGSELFERAKEAKEQTEIANLEEEANLIYSELSISQYMEEIDKTTMSNIVSKLAEKGYKIKQVMTSGTTITGITLDKESISLSVNGTETITVTYEGSSDPINYYAIIGKKYYKMTLTKNGVKVDRNTSEIDSTATQETLTAISNNENVIVESINGNIITLKGGETTGTSTITVTYGRYEPQICTVSVGIRPTEDSEEIEGTAFSTDYGKIDIIWLKDTTKEVVNNPNTPILTSNNESMTAVKWDDTNNIVPMTTPDSSWYNYAENKWANARTANESYFVWIPRYAYRITYYENETSTTPTGYYDGYGQWKAEDGSVRLKLDKGLDTVDYNGNKYIVHPAFDNNVEMGGWSEKTTGFWFAKFEMSGATASDLKSVFGVQSQRNQTIGKQYANARTATYGYIGTTDTFDNKKSYMNSHMVKNSEWGAVAYLTHSKYGLKGEEIYIYDNNNFYTGGGKGTTYITNTNQSTTGNAYGIYDLAGGSWERMAAFNGVDSNNYFSKYEWTKETELTVNSDSTKYVTKYNNNTENYYERNVIYRSGKIGDATKEVNEGKVYHTEVYGEQILNWFEDAADFVTSDYPFFMRGSYGDGTETGIFAFSYNQGLGFAGCGFRVTLSP